MVGMISTCAGAVVLTIQFSRMMACACESQWIAACARSLLVVPSAQRYMRPNGDGLKMTHESRVNSGLGVVVVFISWPIVSQIAASCARGI